MQLHLVPMPTTHTYVHEGGMLWAEQGGFVMFGQQRACCPYRDACLQNLAKLWLDGGLVLVQELWS